MIQPAQIIRILGAIHDELPHITGETACAALAKALSDTFVLEAFLDAAVRHARSIQPATDPPSRIPGNHAVIALTSLLQSAAQLDAASTCDDRHIRLPAVLWSQFRSLCEDAQNYATPPASKPHTPHYSGPDKHEAPK
jgi:hypothetical protein